MSRNIWKRTAGILAAVLLIGCQSEQAIPTSKLLNPGVRRDRSLIKTDALIYNGVGTANNGATNLAEIAESNGMSYKLVSSEQLNSMSLEEIRSFGVILWPGGKATQMQNSLTEDAKGYIREAVVNHGVSYVGFCAGAFITGLYAEKGPDWGFQFIPYDFPYYSLQDQVPNNTAMVTVSFPDGSNRELVWIGGPQFTNFGDVLGKYPDGTSAMAQSWVGKGLVIITGPHPEAPLGWKYGLTDEDGQDYEKAWELISAAYEQTPLKSF